MSMAGRWRYLVREDGTKLFQRLGLAVRNYGPSPASRWPLDHADVLEFRMLRLALNLFIGAAGWVGWLTACENWSRQRYAFCLRHVFGAFVVLAVLMAGLRTGWTDWWDLFGIPLVLGIPIGGGAMILERVNSCRQRRRKTIACESAQRLSP